MTFTKRHFDLAIASLNKVTKLKKQKVIAEKKALNEKLISKILLKPLYLEIKCAFLNGGFIQEAMTRKIGKYL